MALRGGGQRLAHRRMATTTAAQEPHLARMCFRYSCRFETCHCARRSRLVATICSLPPRCLPPSPEVLLLLLLPWCAVRRLRARVAVGTLVRGPAALQGGAWRLSLSVDLRLAFRLGCIR